MSVSKKTSQLLVGFFAALVVRFFLIRSIVIRRPSFFLIFLSTFSWISCTAAYLAGCSSFIIYKYTASLCSTLPHIQ
jgi:hypothetical protein